MSPLFLLTEVAEELPIIEEPITKISLEQYTVYFEFIKYGFTTVFFAGLFIWLVIWGLCSMASLMQQISK